MKESPFLIGVNGMVDRIPSCFRPPLEWLEQRASDLADAAAQVRKCASDLIQQWTPTVIAIAKKIRDIIHHILLRVETA